MAPIVSLLSFYWKGKHKTADAYLTKWCYICSTWIPNISCCQTNDTFTLVMKWFLEEKKENSWNPHCQSTAKHVLLIPTQTWQGTCRASAVTACNAAEDNHRLCVWSCISTSQWAIWSAQGLHNCNSNCQSFLGHVGPCAHYFSSSYISGAVFQGRKHMPS